ncbi:hypothetical protein OVA21_16205 [Dietzia sp. SL131]|uniref:methyltransferase domain-containing protein n=1 Tax=unclassified Dietzia TaxID=2617939 RepID=UPI002276A8B6|nr:MULTISPECIES: methyltransferase domain-containing protein [unclassified Dietzia]MCY1658716.1 hypothetical protein [Dietzia sp. SL131]MDV3356992.1 hypothetical protein [Dietzia sp. IN118]
MTASPHTTFHALEDTDVLVSARSLDEYTDMFGLDEADLKGRIVDCPGGAASAVAEICAAGGDAVAVDPQYALGADDLRGRILEDVERSLAQKHAREFDYDWDVRGGVVGHEVIRRSAADRMLGHLATAPERYVAGALPSLPLADDSADLVLCSHLLFTYADRMDLADHVDAIVEMARVAPEVRIYPLVDHAGNPLPELVRCVIAKLKKERLISRIEPVIRPFQLAATTRLVVERNGRQRP